MSKQTEMFQEMAAKAQGKEVYDLTSTDLVNYFLSNGIDYKGQCQIGILKSGYGVKVGASANLVLATLDVSASADALKQSVIVVQRGPSRLDGTPILLPILMTCLIGRQWSVAATVEAGVGVKAELAYSDGTKPEASASTNLKKNKDKTSSVESFGMSISAFAGLSVDTSVKIDNFFGFDPAPTFYVKDLPASDPPDLFAHVQTSHLRATLASALSETTLEQTLLREAVEIINAVRSGIFKRYSLNDVQNRHKATMGVYLSGVGDQEYAKSVNRDEALKALVAITDSKNESLRGVIAGAAWPHITNAALAGDILGKRAERLLQRLLPFKTGAGDALCWLRMRSAKFNLDASAGVRAGVNAGTALSRFEASASASLAAAGTTIHRTGIRWQTELAAGNKSTLLCTQDTAITYTSLTAAALAWSAQYEATILNIGASESRSGEAVEKGLNLMRYESATLYWRKTGAETKTRALAGSGVTYGQSFVIKNLNETIADSYDGVPTPWLVRAAERLCITPEVLVGFLKIPEVYNVLKSLDECAQTADWIRKGIPRERWPILANSDPTVNGQTWKERAVLLEASFGLVGAPEVVVKDGVPQDVRKTLAPQRGALQSIRLRFRIADHRHNEKSWTLGFKIFGTGVSVGLRSLAYAGTEGVVDLCTIWFDDKGQVKQGTDPAAEYEMEGAVPPVTLFCQ